MSELHHFFLGIPRRRPLGKGKGCHLGPLTHLWGFLLTFWAPSPPLRSHSLISYSIEKGLSFTFSFLRLSPPPAPRCETLWLAGLQLACPPLPAPQLCWPQVSTCPKSGENLQLLGPVLGVPHLGPRVCLEKHQLLGGTFLMTDHWVTLAAVPSHPQAFSSQPVHWVAVGHRYRQQKACGPHPPPKTGGRGSLPPRRHLGGLLSSGLCPAHSRG